MYSVIIQYTGGFLHAAMNCRGRLIYRLLITKRLNKDLKVARYLLLICKLSKSQIAVMSKNTRLLELLDSLLVH